MIATIAVIAAIAEKKKISDRSDHCDHMKPLSSGGSDNNRWDVKSSISAIVVAAIAGEWFPDMIAEFFFLSDRSDHSNRSDHMETRLNYDNSDKEFVKRYRTIKYSKALYIKL